MNKHDDKPANPATGISDAAQDDRDMLLGSRNDVSKTVTKLAALATRTLLLHTESLEPAIFDHIRR